MILQKQISIAHGVSAPHYDCIVPACAQDERRVSSHGHSIHADEMVLAVKHLNGVGMMPVAGNHSPAAVQCKSRWQRTLRIKACEALGCVRHGIIQFGHIGLSNAQLFLVTSSDKHFACR